MSTHSLIVLAGVTLGSLACADANVQVPLQLPMPATRPDVSIAGINDALVAVSKAEKEDAAARVELIKAQADLSSIVIRLRSELETSDEIVEATKAWYAARANYADLVRPILDSVVQRADHRDAAAALHRAQQTASVVCSRAGVTTEERVAVSQAVLAAKVTMGKIEGEALSSDIAVVKARQASLEAAQHLRDLRAQAVRSIQQDPGYLAAKQAVDDARAKVAVTDEKIATLQDRAAGQMGVRRGWADWTTTSDASPDAP